MHATPSSLDSAALLRRLGELAGHERAVQVEFLLHLDELDRRGAWRDAGHGSLWAYCLEALHLREGAAGRRIGAMRVLRRFPVLAAALRDGRLCLSTVALLGPVLSDENADDLVARAAFRTKADVEHLVASLQPRSAPRDGIRKVATRAPVPEALPSRAADATTNVAPPLAQGTPVPAPPSTVTAVAADSWSLRVTMDAAFKADLERLRGQLGHKFPDGNLADVLREAVRCAIEKHGNRKGATAPAQTRKPEVRTRRSGVAAARAIPIEVRRAVWTRDEGQCTWRAADGRRCSSRFGLEVDHVHAAALGGEATVGNLRLLCKAHNALHAEQTFGREWMERVRGAASAAGGFTIAGESGGGALLEGVAAATTT